MKIRIIATVISVLIVAMGYILSTHMDSSDIVFAIGSIVGAIAAFISTFAAVIIAIVKTDETKKDGDKK